MQEPNMHWDFVCISVHTHTGKKENPFLHYRHWEFLWVHSKKCRKAKHVFHFADYIKWVRHLTRQTDTWMMYSCQGMSEINVLNFQRIMRSFLVHLNRLFDLMQQELDSKHLCPVFYANWDQMIAFGFLFKRDGSTTLSCLDNALNVAFSKQIELQLAKFNLISLFWALSLLC